MQIFFISSAVIFSVYSAVKPFKIYKIRFNIVTAPLFSLFILITTGIINIELTKSGILGIEGLRPWEIIIIFFSAAYVSISVDLSGILDFFAFRLVRRADGNGIKLFIFTYIFASILTIFTSNDIVILTLTPIIFYLSKHADIDVKPLLFAEFFAANTMSMLLYIGNPTNIIIANAINLQFAEFSKIMLLPSLTAVILNGLLIFTIFRKKILKKFELRESSTSELRSVYDAVISSSLLLLMLLFLILSEKLSLKIWQITLGFAAVFIAEDILIGIFHIAKNPSLYVTEISSDMKKIYALYGFASNRYDFFVIMKRIPWKILPFITSIFIMTAGLSHYKAIDITSEFLSSLSSSLHSAIFINGSIALILTNIINNQPASIIYAGILINPLFSQSTEITKASAFAVITASNLGANLTLIGALAGIMWEKILYTKGLVISYKDFLVKGLIITPIVFYAALFVLYGICRLGL